jgi:hypothetical protein
MIGWQAEDPRFNLTSLNASITNERRQRGTPSGGFGSKAEYSSSPKCAQPLLYLGLENPRREYVCDLSDHD